MRELETHTGRRQAPPAPSGPLAVLPRAFVLLAGGAVGQSLPARVGRSVLDLPLSTSVRLIDAWVGRLRDLVTFGGEFLAPLPVRVLVGADLQKPDLPASPDGLRLEVELDRGAYRGTAGVLRDLAEEFEDPDHLLVGSSSQCPDAGLLERLVFEADPEAGVTLLVGQDGTPSGLMLVRCGALRAIAAVGFVDLKEQALPQIAGAFPVQVLDAHGGNVSRPIRDVTSYVDALRSWHRFQSLGGVRYRRPFEERWRPAFSVVEEGALVGEGASLHDSVVLRGGVVEGGAEVVRSVVGPGGRVRKRDLVVERLVAGPERARNGASPPTSGGVA